MTRQIAEVLSKCRLAERLGWDAILVLQNDPISSANREEHTELCRLGPALPSSEQTLPLALD